MSKKSKAEQKKQGMTAEQIRAMREEERIASVLPEKTRSQKNLEWLFIWLATVVTTAVVIVVLHYLEQLMGILCSMVLPYLWMVDNSSGFLAELVTKVMELGVVVLVIIGFDFALDINFASTGRPSEVWRKQVKYCLLAAFGSDLLFVVMSRILTGGDVGVRGSLLSRILYYVTKIGVLPLANVMLYLVIPSAVVRMILIFVSDTKEKTELPLTVAATVTLTLGMIGVSASGILGAGFAVLVYVLIQSAAYSVLYHRTNVIWPPVVLYAFVTALYYPVAALLHAI